jgi:hypothetical protein
MAKATKSYPDPTLNEMRAEQCPRADIASDAEIDALINCVGR